MESGTIRFGSTGKVHTEVLQNLMVFGCIQGLAENRQTAPQQSDESPAKPCVLHENCAGGSGGKNFQVASCADETWRD